MGVMWAIMSDANVLTPPRFYLGKSEILECIKIPQLGLLIGVVIDFILHCNRCDANAWYFYAYLHDWHSLSR